MILQLRYVSIPLFPSSTSIELLELAISNHPCGM